MLPAGMSSFCWMRQMTAMSAAFGISVGRIPCIVNVRRVQSKEMRITLHIREKGVFLHSYKQQTDMDVKIEESWKRHIGAEFDKPYFAALTAFVHEEYRRGTCYPPGRLIFNAFNLCPFDKVKVVIIGQDPYHEPGQAQGLCFSVNDGVPFRPRSLIYSRKYRPTSARLCHRAEALSDGPNRACCCSTPRLRCARMLPEATSATDGKSLPTP